MKETAQQLLNKKISFTPVRQNKQPIGKWREFQKSLPTEEQVEKWLSSKNGYGKVTGLAVICGKISGGLLCIDFDAPELFPRWCEAIGEDLRSLIVYQQTGGGGYQVFVRTEDPGKNQKLAWIPDETDETGRKIAIETRGEGGYALIPPSLHPSGNHYEWRQGGVYDIPVVSQQKANFLLDTARSLCQAPYAKKDLAAMDKKQQDLPLRKRPPIQQDQSVIQSFNQRFTIMEVLQWYGYEAAHERDRMKRPGGKSPSVWITDGKSFHHSSNDPLNDNHAHDPFDVFVQMECRGDYNEAAKKASDMLGLSKKTERTKNIQAAKQTATETPAEDPDAWRAKLQWNYDKHGNPTSLKSVPINALYILTHAEEWRGKFGFDEFANTATLLENPPLEAEYKCDEDEFPKPLQDLDINRIGFWLSEKWGINVPTIALVGVVYTIASTNKYHPVKNYLSELKWDGTIRVSSWLQKYLGATGESDEYISLVGRLWLLSAVARIFAPGCKADNVLILEGKQGIKKSTALQVLSCGWFTDTPMDLGNKDAYLAIQGIWIVEMAELDALMRSESSAAKAFFTSTCDKYRPPYGREPVQVRRQCVFAGTVNHDDYLKDPTGGRRYWPVKCNEINLDSLKEDRDQLWAESVARYKAGERWWPEGDTQRCLCEGEQSLRQIEDPWEYAILKYISPLAETTVSDILELGLEMEIKNWNRSHETRVGNVMRRFGWHKKRIRRDGKVLTVYVKGEE